MYRVDLPVLTTLHVVGTQLAWEERAVIAALVVVLYLEIGVAQQALGDHEVMRFIAPKPVGRNRPEPERHVHSEAHGEDRSPADAEHRRHHVARATPAL